METKTKNNKANFISLNCKVCNKKYEINTQKIEVVPLWQFENCSKTCHLKCSTKKLINNSKCIILPKVQNKLY